MDDIETSLMNEIKKLNEDRKNAIIVAGVDFAKKFDKYEISSRGITSHFFVSSFLTIILSLTFDFEIYFTFFWI